MTIPPPQGTNVGPNSVDRNQYGDHLSTCERRIATGVDGIVLGTMGFSATRAPRTQRFCTKLRFHVRTALAVGGVITFAIYYGPDPAALETTFPPFPATTFYGSIGLKEVVIPTVDVLEGHFYAFTWARTGLALLNPTVSVCGDAGLDTLLNPVGSPVGWAVSGTKNTTTFPTTLDITTGWTANGRIPWYGLAL